MRTGGIDLFCGACVAVCALLCGASAAAQPAAAPPGVDAALVRLSEARLHDADTILGFAAEGATLYADEPIKLSGYQYCSQAVSLAEAGEFRRSLRAASKALHLAVNSNDEDLLALAERDLAIVMSYSGNLDKAEQLARRSLMHRVKEPAIVAGPAYKTIADVQARRQEHAAAIASYEQAARESSDRFRPLVLASLANTLIDAGDVGRARTTLAGVALTEDNKALNSQLARIRARLLLAEGKPKEALAAYQALAAESSGFDAAYQRLWALEGISNAQMALGDKRAAADALAEALRALDGVRARFRSEEIKLGLFSDLQSLFERAIQLFLDLGDAPRALDASEKSRARAFLDAVRGRAPVAASQVATVDAASVQTLLAPDERVLEFHSLSDRLVVWVVSRDAVRTVSLPELDRRTLTARVEELRASITGGKRDAPGLADRLGKQLIEPLGLTANDRLVVVPHGPLHYLPFQALRVDQAYLIERHPLATVPSMSIAGQLLARRQASPVNVVAFGNPTVDPEHDLPGAEKEVSQLVSLFAGQATSYIQRDATKTRFKQVASDATILHVAAHAEADLVDPLRSRVLLASENERPSFLEASEVLELDLSKVSIVTLSACESALGRIASGDEVLGFPRSFLSAGTDSLIASLWPVLDEPTALMMDTVYRRLRQGSNLQDAMRDGQLAVLKTPRMAHPFFWAPFNLIGNWRVTLER